MGTYGIEYVVIANVGFSALYMGEGSSTILHTSLINEYSIRYDCALIASGVTVYC